MPQRPRAISSSSATRQEVAAERDGRCDRRGAAGAHPTAPPSLYRRDERHLKDYVQARVSTEAFEAYLQKYVPSATTRPAYIDSLGGAQLVALTTSESNPR